MSKSEKPAKDAAKREKTPSPEGGVSASVKTSAAIGVVAATGLAIMLNVVVARHYKRWDWTSAKLYSLSEPTKGTLRGLTDPVQVNVLLSSSDPLYTSVKHLLEAYTAETQQLEIRYLDPDRKPAEFMAFQQKYGLLAGKAEDGRVMADASIVVVKGDRKWFLTPSDLVDASEADEGRARPKLEQGITVAIRNVLGGDRIKICFIKGHGELETSDPGPRGLAELHHRLERNNTDIEVVDTTAPDAPGEPWKDCAVVVDAGPQVPLSTKEAKQLIDYWNAGGSLFLLVNPMADPEKKKLVPTGLESVALLGGIDLHNDVVIEIDPKFRPEGTMGETFLGQPQIHPVSEALVGERAANAKIVFQLAQSLGKNAASVVQASNVVTTSKDAFGMADFFSWAEDAGPPQKRPGDRDGPLAVVMAAEQKKLPGEKGRGQRMVVAGSQSIILRQAWTEPQLRGGAYLVESAISWLSSRPQMIDVPEKPAIMAGLRLTEDSVSEVGHYVTYWIPLAAGLVGLAVYLRRRSTEKRREPSPPRPKKESAES